ncbi:MAG: Arc family DNA-binding protein [Lentisphaerae bacterium]|nr:Arc family DNA-binding protein [Lentisphaerota bacterium]MBT4816508.1 Arc family DNA-binding protein [Lentisphaerota bacterium]MBT5608365.1 Arc family DNA-binding protein [Lentisphaerota bacterium]MBT7060982.1 Arc family DNA-binding protein [Lentisphaerota bacterium]MBT7848349.1 Arc family DNA-binding protein [Lentisphaerota bacterium]
MSTITLKDVPPDLHAALKTQAKAHGRSLNREIIAALNETVHASYIDAAAVADQARAVRETMGIYVTQADLTAARDSGRP